MSNSRGGKFLFGAFIGAAVGAVGGMLFAPKRGEELRQELKKTIDDKFDEYREPIGRVAQQAQTQGAEIKNQAQNQINGVITKGKEVLEKVVQQRSEVVMKEKPVDSKNTADTVEKKPADAKNTKRKFFRGV